MGLPQTHYFFCVFTVIYQFVWPSYSVNHPGWVWITEVLGVAPQKVFYKTVSNLRGKIIWDFRYPFCSCLGEESWEAESLNLDWQFSMIIIIKTLWENTVTVTAGIMRSEGKHRLELFIFPENQVHKGDCRAAVWVGCLSGALFLALSSLLSEWQSSHF